jgi:hypothetical protein
MHRRVRWGFMVSLALLASAPSSRADERPTIGVLGDSYSDEYQFYPPDRSTSRNWVECLAATRDLDFGRFSLVSRGAPRHQGFEYNWACSAATSEDLIATGQHTGLAAQVARGEVQYVVIFIGGNDFIEAVESAQSAEAFERVSARAAERFRTAVKTILSASPTVRIVAVTVPDIRQLPEMRERLGAPGRRSEIADNYEAALAHYNSQIRKTGFGQPRVAIVDFDLMTRVANLASRDRTKLLGRKLDRLNGGNDLGHLFLADMIVHALNVKFAAGIKPLDNGEALVGSGAIARTSEPGMWPPITFMSARDRLRP